MGFSANTIGAGVLIIFLFLLYRRYTKAGQSDEEKTQDYETLLEKRRPGPGCPVMFTDKSELAGARRCFEIGDVPNLTLEGTGIDPEDEGMGRRKMKMRDSFPNGKVMSVSVRPGYHVKAFSEPDFGGDVLFNRKGPSDRSFSDAYEEPLSARKMRAIHERGVDPNASRKASDAFRPRSLRVGFV